MQEELKNNLINVLEIRDLIAKKYDQLTLENDNDCKDFLTLINSTLGKTFGYDFIHLFHIKKHKINATFTQLKSVKFNQKSIQNINVFDLELSQFKKGNIIYINQLNQHELTRNQTGITFEHHNTNAAVDVPLYKLNDIVGIIRFEAHEEIFSERFFLYLTTVFEYLKKRELKKTISQLSQQLDLNRSFYQELVHKSKIAFYYYHIKSKLMTWEKGSHHVFGLDNFSELDKDFFINHIHPDDYETLQISTKQVIHHQSSLSLTYRLLLHDEYRTFLAHQKFISIHANDYLIGYVEDITNPLLKVSEVEKYKINLDQIALEKIKELENSVAHVENKIQAKSSFISNMSHEIRTPMNSILGYAHLLETMDLTEEQEEYVSRINDASKHLLSIVNDILDISKIEAGKIVIEKLSFRLDKLLDSIKDIFEESIRQKRLYLDIEILHCPNYLVGDENRIRQILINLISNAIKFTETGGISLVVDSKESLVENELLFEFKVRDTGIGMTPNQLKKLFTDFEQADISTTRIYGGTGLGLSISKRLAKLMQGNLSVFSSLNDGTEFILTLPLSIELDNLEKNQTNHQDLIAKKGSKILLADDNLLNQKLAERILQNMGMEVIVASNGSIALELAKKNHFDLIIMDMQMPIMDGLEATKHIRIFDQKTPIIAMTGNVSSEDKQMAYDAGMNDYLIKPIDPSSLDRALIRFIPDMKNK